MALLPWREFYTLIKTFKNGKSAAPTVSARDDRLLQKQNADLPLS
jgi:hypothetical protein